VERQLERIPYDVDELRSPGPQRTFSGAKLKEIAMPIGGIGTGSISLGGRGQLMDWEIFNRPNKGFRPAFTFATLWARAEGCEPVTKVVESPVQPPYTGSHGAPRNNGEGFPHLSRNTFRGEYPFAWIDFQDERMPLKVSLEAFNPFIPLNDFDSSLPVAILTYRLKNVCGVPVSATLAFTIQNVIGYGGAGDLNTDDFGQNLNLFRQAQGVRGMVMTGRKHGPQSHRSGSMAVATTWQEISYTGALEGAAWFEVGHRFWDTFSASGQFNDVDLREPTPDKRTATCALGMRVKLEPGQSAELPLIITWHFPNFIKYWGSAPQGERPQWKTHYASQFADAWEVAGYVGGNLERLRAQSMEFHDALFGSTLPPHVLEAASSQASTLKSPTCLRLEDGTFYGFEGCSDQAGCCEGSCTHVWNYAQTLAFLFPDLERSMRTTDYTYNLREEDGRMCFRLQLPRGTSNWNFHAAADGQLGGVIKTYRDWLLCGDEEWLRSLWPKVKKALSYAWVEWDKDRDGVAEGVQHNTYDIEFLGPNPFIGAFYMGALRAAEEMARYLGEHEQAGQYRELFEKGSRKMDEMLFNGEYYVQKYDPQQAPRNQFGDGCLSDQMLGQWLAAICDLGYLFRPENVRSALASVFRYNWRTSLSEHPNPQRIYALNDEAGLLMCSWPKGGRPQIPTPYCDEVWTGIEYQVASHLIMEDFVEEGLAIVKAARERHDGERRNPWNEPECGSHYARAMSSWGLILALSGYHYSAPQRTMRFNPKVCRDNFRVFWSTGGGWGTYRQHFGPKSGMVCLSVNKGSLGLSRLSVAAPQFESAAVTARLNDEQVECTCRTENGMLVLEFPQDGVTILQGDTLRLALASPEA